SGVGCEDLTPVSSEKFSLEDSTVTLSYKYPKLSTGDNLFWYRQYPGKPPEFLISHSASGQVLNNPVPGLKVKVEEKQISMNISSAAVSDSAVYYCALEPTLLHSEPFGDKKGTTD
uniref:Immunoglobulin V-set domain-containing protein n=1 Tax=Mastacembelus armatus TaxID=205130 RepID=A0A3Q3LKB8_9TELE